MLFDYDDSGYSDSDYYCSDYYQDRYRCYLYLYYYCYFDSLRSYSYFDNEDRL